MNLFSIDARCKDCGKVFDILVPRDSRDDPVPCTDCGGEAFRTISKPNLTKASYVDGHKRGKDYQDMKIAAKLEMEKMNLPPEKRGEINKEIHKVKSIKK